MIIEKKNIDEFYSLFKKRQKLETVLSNIPLAMKDQTDIIKYHIEMYGEAAQEEYTLITLQIKALARNPELINKTGIFGRKKYKKVEDLPLTEVPTDV